MARVGGRVAGVTFSSPGPVRTRRRLVLRLGPDERYNEGSYVIPEFRGRKVLHQLMATLYRGEAAAGVRRMYSLVDPANSPSMRTHENLGAVPIFRFSIVAWMLVNFLWPRPPRSRRL